MIQNNSQWQFRESKVSKVSILRIPKILKEKEYWLEVGKWNLIFLQMPIAFFLFLELK